MCAGWCGKGASSCGRAGIPVATFAIGNAGAANAALFAAAMLAAEFPEIGDALAAFRARQTEEVVGNDDPRR